MAKSFQETIKSETPTLVDFYAEWCGPCKTMKPILEQVKKRVGTNAKIITVDVDRNQHAANAFKIRGVPTLILFKNGEVLWRQSGVVPADKLTSLIQENI
jgi:thioredoxin 1